jgi:hypothetical protein
LLWFTKKELERDRRERKKMNKIEQDFRTEQMKHQMELEMGLGEEDSRRLIKLDTSV